MTRHATLRSVRWDSFRMMISGALALSFLFPYSSTIATRTHQEVQALELNKPYERELSGGQSHDYQITLMAGQFLHLVVEQRGIDVVVRLIGPDSKLILEVDSPNGEQGPEPVYHVAETAGFYRLAVQSLEKDARPGRYKVEIAELREAKLQDRTLIAALKASAEAEQLERQQTKESLLKAIEKGKEALPLWRSVSERDKEAQTLDKLGDLHFLLSDFDNALQYYSQALIIKREIKDRAGEADTVSSLGAVHLSLRKPQKALECFQQARQLCQNLNDGGEEGRAIKGIGDAYNQMEDFQKAIAYYKEAILMLRAARKDEIEANTLNNLGAVHVDLGEIREALDHFHQALAIRQKIDDRRGQANSSHNLGQLHFKRLGEPLKAIDYLNRALHLREIAGDRAGEAVTSGALGDVYYELGQLQEALIFYHRALRLREKIGDDRGSANTLSSIGIIYSLLGEDQKAIDYYNQSLQLRRKAGDAGGEASTLNNLGAIYLELGKTQEAFDYFHQAIERWNAVRDRGGEARARGNLAKVHLSSREYKQALDNFTQVFDLSRAAGDRRAESTALSHLGDVYAGMGEEQKALESYNQALVLSRAIKFDSHEAATLTGIARFERKRGNIEEARALIEKALEITESLRSRQTSQESRAAYFGTVQSRYEFYVDLLIQLHHLHPGEKLDELAFQVCERARARSLLELLAESRANIRQGVDAKLLESERTLQRELGAKAEIVSRLKNSRPGTPPARAALEKGTAALEKEIDALTAEYQRVRAEIRRSSPRYAAITQPQPLSVAEIQQQALDSKTLMLEYFLGEERSYLWAVTPTTITCHELPTRNNIEKEARKLYDLLAVDAAKSRNQGLAAYRTTVAKLSQILLAPVASQLGRKRLVIVADGALQMIPFAALFEPETGARPKGRRANSQSPLIVNHEIVLLPSASTIASLRRDLAGRKPAARMVAALARPVFSEQDFRFGDLAAPENKLSDTQSTTPITHLNVTRAIEDTGLTSGDRRIPDLPSTEREAKYATSFHPSLSKLYLGFEANYEAATNPDLSQYRYIHFATHGLIDTIRPELSGILLSLYDEKRQPRDQGMLRLGDIYNLKLPAELIVLSACRTALGKDIRGEGLVGLTRGFMYAGAPRVVATLWQVSDEETAIFMKRFYTAMLGQWQMRPAAALRQAQLETLRRPQTRAPYFWAAFTIQGEWR